MERETSPTPPRTPAFAKVEPRAVRPVTPVRSADEPDGAPSILRPKRHRMDPAEARAFDAAPVQRFDLSDLSAVEREQALEGAGAAGALLLKGLLHRADPKAFPVPRDPAAPEAVAARLARELTPRAFERVAPNLERVLREPARLARIVGARRTVNLRAASLDVAPRQLPASVTASATTRGAKYRRVHLVLRAIHCKQITTPRDNPDEIVLGGVLIGAGGNVVAANSIVCGEFSSGEYADFGEIYLGQYSLRSTSGYPKHMYCIFKLVESDSDDAEVARDLTSTISFLASTILSAVASPLVGATAGAVLQAIGDFVSNLIDEDEFRPYGVRLTLASEDQFGGHDSGRLATGDITGHGGRYRVGYRWLLGA
jgi:hypothetical protein